MSDSAALVADMVVRIIDGEVLPYGLRGLDEETRARVRAVAHPRNIDPTHMWRRLLRIARRHAASRQYAASHRRVAV